GDPAHPRHRAGHDARGGSVNDLAIPFVVAAALLVAGGALKASRPLRTATALRAAGLRGGARLVRVGGVAEIVVGVGALVWGTRVWGVLVAVSYATFT